MFLCFVISTIVISNIGASIVRGTTLPFTLSDPASAMTTAMNLVSAGWARVRLRDEAASPSTCRHLIQTYYRYRDTNPHLFHSPSNCRFRSRMRRRHRCHPPESGLELDGQWSVSVAFVTMNNEHLSIFYGQTRVYHVQAAAG